MDGFVRLQMLILAPACPTPKIHGVIHGRVDAGGNAVPLTIAGANQEQIPGGQQVLHEQAHPLNRVGRCERLFCEYVDKLAVIIVSEAGVAGNFHADV